MLVLKYFLVVGTLMVAGLIALNAHMAPSGSASAAAVTHASSAASLAIVPPKPVAVVEPAVEPAPPAVAKPAKGSRHSSRSTQAHQRSR